MKEKSKLQKLDIEVSVCESSIEVLKTRPDLAIGVPSCFCNFSAISTRSKLYDDLISYMISDNETRLLDARKKLKEYIETL